MKTKKSLVTIVAVLIVAIGFATEKVKMNVVPLSPDKALLAFSAETPTSFELTIRNDIGATVYYYKTKNEMNAYRSKIDVSELENGNYQIALNCGKSSLISDFVVSNSDIKTGPVLHSEAPCFSQQNDKLNVSFINIAQKQVYYNVYHEGIHMAGGKLGKDLSIQKRLDLSKLDNGKYEVVITDEYNDHSYMVCK